MHVYDVRRLPADSKAAKLPSALAMLGAASSAADLRAEGARLTGLAVCGSVVVASDTDFGLSVWDVAAPPTAEVT